MTRVEHLAWCKERALAHLDGSNGPADGLQALGSMFSDIMRHPETVAHESTNMLGLQLFAAGRLNTCQRVRDWILGYN